MSYRSILTVTIACALIAPTAYAAGSGSNNPPVKTETTKKCKKGKIWHADKKKCVRIEASQLNDDAIYSNARELAYDGQYDNALKLLDLAQNQSDPRILNYKGFTNRKMGNTKLAMNYYQQALDIDPKYILARSYFGQAKLQNGDIEGAKQQLALIKDISGTNNWPFESLSNAISGTGKYEY